jgi:hypothetical protein
MISLFNSALILTINLWRGISMQASQVDAQKETAEINKCINIFRVYEPRYEHSLGIIIDVVSSLSNHKIRSCWSFCVCPFSSYSSHGTPEVILHISCSDLINTVMSANQCPRDSSAASTFQETHSESELCDPHLASKLYSFPAQGSEMSWNSRQHFNIPLHTSDLGALDLFPMDYGPDQATHPGSMSIGRAENPPDINLSTTLNASAVSAESEGLGTSYLRPGDLDQFASVDNGMSNS